MQYLQEFIDWFNSLNITIDKILLVVFLLFIAGGFFRGLIKGLWKTSFSAIVTLVLIIIAFFSTPAIVNFLKTVDLTSFNINIEGQKLTSLKDLPQIIESIEPVGDYFKDSNLTGTIVEVIFAFFSISIFAALVSIIWSMGWIIITPLYHIVFKHFIPKTLRKKKLRLLGGVFGAFRSLVILSMLLLPYSMADIVISEVDAQKHGSNIELAFEISTAYGRSFMGKMMDYLGMYGAPLDEAMLTYLTGMNVNNKPTSMMKELKQFARAYNVLVVNDVIVVTGDEFSFDQNKLTDNVINQFVDTLFEAELANTVLSDILIIAINTIDSTDEIEIDINDSDKEDIITAIKEIVEWKNEIKVFVNIYKELVDDDNQMLEINDILSDDDKVDIIATNIGDSAIFKSAFPLVFRFLISALEDNGVLQNVSSDQIDESVVAIKEISNYKSEIESLASIYKLVVDENGEMDDILVIFEDEDKIDTLANTVNNSTIISELVPYLIHAFLSNDEYGATFSDLGIDVNSIDVFDDSILWGNELRVIGKVIKELDGFDSDNLDGEAVSGLFTNLKQSALLAPVLPNVVANFVDKINSNYNISDISAYVNLNYLPGLLKYDIDKDTDYFDRQLESLFDVFDLLGSTGINFEDNSFVPILEIIRDLENDASAEPSITINLYANNEVTGQETIKPTVIQPRALENLVRTITDQDFVKNLLGNDAADNLNYDALYDDEYELERIGNIVNVFFSNTDLINGDDAQVAANLTLISSSKLLKPVLPNLIETQLNTYLGPTRQISVTEADLENINWTDEIGAVRYLKNQFVENSSFESVTSATITNLFSSVRDTNIISKVVINELNSYMDDLDADYQFDKTKLGDKQANTLNKLLEFKNPPSLNNNRAGIKALVNGFGVFDQEIYDKELINAILPSFLQRMNEDRVIDKSVFNSSTSYTNTSNDISNIIDAIEAFESATMANIAQRAEALKDALNEANEVTSELIVHSKIKFDVPIEAKSYFEGQITNSRIESIINYQ